MAKHAKSRTPSDADLRGDPLIGASRALRGSDEDVSAIIGENTFEGDRENQAGRPGDIEKSDARGGRPLAKRQFGG